MTKLLLQRAFVGLCLIIAATPAIAAKRVALVIGNDAYEQVTKLQKAVNDARAMSETLTGIGFKVLRGENLSRRDLNRQIQAFTSQLDVGDEALFFFAGHGVEINGRNYLLPTDIPKAVPGQENFVTTEAIAVDRVLDRIRERGTRVSILVLDACRDNPFPKNGTRSVGGTRGLVRMPAPEGTFIMYSAGVGQTALDRLADNDPNANSVFTRSLIPLLKSPGMSLTETARRIRRDVQKLARTVSHEQRPAYYDEVTGNFFFAGRGDAKTLNQPEATTGRLSPVAQAWSLINDTNAASDLEAFIKEYPDSFYAKLATARLAKLMDRKVALVVPPKPALPSETKPIDAPVHGCDHLAASPLDLQKVTDGVAYDLVRAEPAVQACRQAVDAHPGVTRFEYQLGRALAKDGSYLEAARWYRRAAEKGHAGAMNNLGSNYSAGKGFDKDEREAVRWYRKAAEKGQANAMYNLAVAYDDGLGVAKDDREAARWYRKAAEKGYAGAMNNLGLKYLKGEGVDKDEREAVRWFRKAAEKDQPYAMHNLALAYDNGRGVDKDSREAVRWHRKAAEKGHAFAMYSLATAYRSGEGIDKDDREAARWYRKAAEKGNVAAMNRLAWMYRKGEGVAEDDKKSVKWFGKAANEGSAYGMYFLAWMHERGEGVAVDGKEAVKWYRRSANLKYPAANHALARLHTTGKIVSKDSRAAARYMIDALKAGFTPAVKRMTTSSGPWGKAFRQDLQRLMRDEGVYSGAIDGNFGPGTKRAIEALAKK